MTMRLHLGCGPIQPAGWINVDPDPRWDAMYGNPLDRGGLPWPDETFECAYANHVLQAVAYPDLVPWLREVRRVLADGGVLRLVVPDLLLGVRNYVEGDSEPFSISDELEPTLDGKLCAWLSQCSATRSVFTPGWLRELVLRAGFTHTLFAPHGQSVTPGLAAMDTRPDESCRIEAW